MSYIHTDISQLVFSPDSPRVTWELSRKMPS